MSMANGRNGGDRRGAFFIQAVAIIGLVAAVLTPAFVERQASTDWKILMVLALVALGADAPQVIDGLRVIFGRGGGGNGDNNGRK